MVQELWGREDGVLLGRVNGPLEVGFVLIYVIDDHVVVRWASWLAWMEELHGVALVL